MISQERLKQLIHYNPETGVFIWISKPSKRVLVGSKAGCVTGGGYVQIRIDGRAYRASRLAWLFSYGYMPDDFVDHKNRKRDDDRLVNLRLATPAESTFNTGAYSNNTSGFKGVAKRVLSTGRVRWMARARLRGKLKVIGSYDSREEAGLAYAAFAKVNHGVFCSCA